jgi:hypothetical protein
MLDEVFGRGVLMAAQSHGIRVPQEMRMVVASYEDSPVVFPDSWSRCEINLGKCGAFVVSLLRDLLDAKPVAHSVSFPFTWHNGMEMRHWREDDEKQFNALPELRLRDGREILEVAGVDVPSGQEDSIRPVFGRAFPKESVR